MSDSQSTTLSFKLNFAGATGARIRCRIIFNIGDGIALQPNQQDSDIGGRYSGDAGSLTNGCRPDSGKLLQSFKAETRDRGKIKRVRNALVFHFLEFFNFQFLAINVPGVFGRNFNLLNYFIRQSFVFTRQISISNFGPAQHLY